MPAIANAHAEESRLDKPLRDEVDPVASLLADACAAHMRLRLGAWPADAKPAADALASSAHSPMPSPRSCLLPALFAVVIPPAVSLLLCLVFFVQAPRLTQSGGGEIDECLVV